MIAAVLVGCAVAASPTDVVLRGAILDGTPTDIALVGGKIAAIGPGVGAGLPVVDVAGRYVVPAFVDSHVHLAYRFDPAKLGDGGIVAAVDLAAPIEWIGRDAPPLRVLWSGPMVTAPDGYPLSSWGAAGYGWPATDPDTAAAAVDLVLDAGAKVVKFPVTGAPTLDAASRAAVVQRAHARGAKVAVHALGDSDALQAANAGADVLAHVPVQLLGDATVAAWGGRAVIPTLSAFGGAPEAVENLRRLRHAGATVLYGTDFGNSTAPGISRAEIRLMVAAGMDGRAILAAGTSAPAAYWGWEDLGAVAVGKSASLLVLTADPLVKPEILADPEQVWIGGVRRR